MSFLGKLVDEFSHHGQRNEEQGYPPQQYGQDPYQSQGPPQVPPPWIAEWDGSQGRWMFINRETGQRTHEYPQSYGGSYGQQGYPPQGGYPPQSEYPPQGYSQTQPEKKDHTGRNIALGAVAGVAGGALLMHEGEEMKEDWDEDKARWEDDKYRMENDVQNNVYNAEQDVQDFPEDAARWTGDKVQEVEDIPQDIENRWDDAVQDVEDAPEDAANWVGDKVGDVERFGDNIDDAYDQGRDDARYDDDNY